MDSKELLGKIRFWLFNESAVDYIRRSGGLLPMPGNDTGFEALHTFSHGNNKYHLHIGLHHQGEGNYKAVVQFGPENKAGFKRLKDVPAHIMQAAANKAGKTVLGFVKDNQINSITAGGIPKIGGIDERSKLYRSVFDKIATESGGKYKSENLSWKPLGIKLGELGTKMSRTEPTSDYVRSGTVAQDPNEDPVMQKYRGKGYSGSKSSSGSGSSRGSSAGGTKLDIKSDPITGKFGISGSKGPYKEAETSELKKSAFAGSGASSAGK